MKIAVTCKNDEVFQHFGHTPEFALFETDDCRILSEKRISSEDSGHGALALILVEEMVDLLICGGIGSGAINALNNAGIKVAGGAEGNVREVVTAYLSGTLLLRKDFHCSHHHSSEHNCGNHSCGNCTH